MIRNARPADITGILHLWDAAGAAPTLTDSQAGLRALLARSPDALLVVEVDGQVVGSVIAGWDGWRGNLYRLVVHPDHQRRGLATSLVREAEHRLSLGGARRISALVLHEEDGANSFWRAAGYTLQAEIGRYYRNDR